MNRAAVARAVLALVIHVAAAGTAAAQGLCPLNTLNCGEGDVSSSEPARTISCDLSEYSVSGSAAYDLRAGTVSVSGAGGDITGSGFVETLDLYRVGGVAPGTPLTFHAELHVGGGISLQCGYYPSGGIAARIELPAANAAELFVHSGCSEEFCCGGGASTDSVLRIAIQVPAGDEFGLRLRLSASARFGYAAAGGTLRFSDLPPGAVVTSCQGFRQDFPVPARSRTWGGVKALYR